MLIHYRYEGKTRRTICGQRYRPGRHPPVWRREWAALELPAATRDQIDSRGRFVCPECANTAAIGIRSSQQRQGSPNRPRRHWSETDAEDGEF